MRRKQAEFATDSAAFEAFYRRHVEGITRFLARRVDDPHMVADLVADVFLAAMESAYTYGPGRGSEVAWLYGVARNTLTMLGKAATGEPWFAYSLPQYAGLVLVCAVSGLAGGLAATRRVRRRALLPD
ncbi:sigma factor [Nonomuraea angiospora]|uniref:RNA polymerase sigma factor n=1 Tax=Nonomuraea angiospora TaxID=46172 RepID=UPI00332A8D06